MAEQQLTGTSQWIHAVMTTSQSRRSARIVLTVLAIHQATNDDPRGDWHEISLLDLADLSDKAPRDVRHELRALSDLGEVDYRIIDSRVWFRVVGGDR